MERVATDTLSEVVRQEVHAYAGEGMSVSGPSMLYYTENPQEQIYCVTAPYNPAFKKAELVIMARIVNEQVIIDVDKTNRPLQDALHQAGVPQEQIVLAWDKTL